MENWWYSLHFDTPQPIQLHGRIFWHWAQIIEYFMYSQYSEEFKLTIFVSCVKKSKKENKDYYFWTLITFFRSRSPNKLAPFVTLFPHTFPSHTYLWWIFRSILNSSIVKFSPPNDAYANSTFSRSRWKFCLNIRQNNTPIARY